MVKVREAHPLLVDGSIDLDLWITRVISLRSDQEIQLLRTACELSKNSKSFEQGLIVAEVLNSLSIDTASVVVGIIYGVYCSNELSANKIKKFLGEEVLKLVLDLQKMNSVHSINTLSEHGDLARENLHNLRKMLLAVVEDVRVVLIKLALHTCEMRAAVVLSDPIKRKLAYESKEIYTPLANRLGIGQIKWELEDLTFRFLEPTAYKNIAKLLDERRIDRQEYIDKVIKQIDNYLSLQDIYAELSGRAKHIYSIWRKMQRKMVGYNEIYDVRAIRIIVPEIENCYAALGVIHTLWQHVPKEFDDYIASPKNNGYQSLHTAVVGPDGKILEVQIRTQDMHEQSELGVSAHWRYKEKISHEPNYEKKINNLRQILNWQDELFLEGEAVESLRAEFFEDRIYVLTPRGEVIDLPQGSTPLDFAYHIHTEVGHQCRGAKINGNMVALTKPLQSGVQVEILVAKHGGPSRDWLNPHLNYMVTSKAKARVMHWFKQQDRHQNIQAGRDLINRELKRLGIDNISLRELAANIANCKTDEDLLAGIGSGDIKISQVLGALECMKQPITMQSKLLSKQKNLKSDNIKLDRFKNAEVKVAGVGNLLSRMARCCRPIPGDEVIGYITIGEGVSVHRQDCINILHAKDQKRSRLIEVSWGREIRNQYSANIVIKAYNRLGLLRDITAVLVSENIDIANMKTFTDKQEHTADFNMSLEVSGIEMLGKVLARIQQIRNVVEVFRAS